MKAIIIDDEKHVREGLILLAEWDKYGIDTIYEAGDGDQAIELITKHRPEIIFTDMRMPKRDGISLLQWLHSSKVNSKTIVVSGYDDFQYLRNAIRYGSFDYLLKPIDPEALNQTLEKAVTEWNKQAITRKSQLENKRVVNEVKPLYWDHLFSGILDKDSTKFPNSVVEKIETEFKIDVRFSSCRVGLIPMKVLVEKQFLGDKELAFFTILNICNELLRKSNSGVGFRNVNKDDELVIILWGNANALSLFKEMHSIIYQFTHVNCKIASGETFSSFEQLASAYQSAVQVFLKHNLLESKRRIVSYKEIKSHSPLHLLDYSEEMKLSIQSGSIQQIDQILERIYQAIQTTNYFSIEELELWENEFDLLKKHWLQEYEISHLTKLYKGNNYWEANRGFSFSKFQEEKRKEFHALIQTLYDVEYQKEKNTIQQIADYIKNNYKKDIKLQEIADRFYLSREYISRKFKQEFKETITDYLVSIRIEKAKKLLENPHIKIYEIAYEVGYQDDKYFSKVFKKITGLTPNEYRNTSKKGNNQ